MLFSKNSLSLALLTLGAASSTANGECVSPESITCSPTAKAPVLDGDLSDWSGVEGIEAPITAALGVTPYQYGDLSIKCVYDDTRIYFAFEVPGAFRFDSEDDHKCAAISTMMKMGPDAEYFNMGGCPNAMAGCNADGTIPSECDSYKVDVGGHWELKTTEQGVAYPINVADGTGNDPVANKDDEIAVSPYCRLDDGGPDAGNEWEAAWLHTSPQAPEVSPNINFDADATGSYVFEMSRLLQTKSPATDAQLEAGGTYGFGVAYWDPFQIEETGWTKVGHFVTGCSQNWINLVLDDGTGTPPPEGDPSGAGAKSIAVLATTVLAFVAAFVAM